MNQAIKRMLFLLVAVILLLAACAPAPAATQDPAIGQVQQTLDALSAAQNSQSATTPDPEQVSLKQTLEALVAALATQTAHEVSATPTPATEVPPLQLTMDALGTAQAAQQATEAQVSLEQTVNAVAAEQSAQGTQQALTFPTPSQNCNISTSTPSASTAAPQPPQITSVQPGKGETYGGTKVTITGSNFITSDNRRAEFCFGNFKAIVDQCTDTECTVISPSNRNAGDVDVIANIDGVTGTLEAGFRYLIPPTVISVSPNSGPITGGTRVTVQGTGFSTNTTFYFGINPARNVSCSPDQCTVISPGIDSNEEIVVWVQALEKGAKSQLDTSSSTQQTFKYTVAPRYACDAMLIAPSSMGPYEPGEGFRIKWVVKNIGTSAWPAGQDLKYSGGTNMGEISSMEIGYSLQPNDTFTVAMDAKAPDNPGLYYMNWIVAGQSCSLYVAINVE